MDRNGSIDALVFDVYGTLFDLHSLLSSCEKLFPGQGTELIAKWRAKQLEYTWVRSLSGRYENFESITSAALRFSSSELQLGLGPSQTALLMETYLRLAPYPETGTALAALSGFKLAILSNGSPRMLNALLQNAGMSALFQHVISAGEAKTYKPSLDFHGQLFA